MIKTVSINIQPNDKNSLPVIERIIDHLKSLKIRVLLPDYDIFKGGNFIQYIVDDELFLNESDMVIVVGGDGTILRSARCFAETNKPILGINRGRLGFLVEFSPDEVFDYLDDILSDKFRLSERSLLEVVHMRGDNELDRTIFMNDAVMSRGGFSRPIRIDLSIDKELLHSYSGDGLIVATPTGSTAYSLSAGGPIITPSVENIYIINPICPHALAIRPMIVSTKNTLKASIATDSDNLLLTLDGQVAIQIEAKDEILFRGSDKRVNLISHPTRNYYRTLREKLGWGGNLS